MHIFKMADYLISGGKIMDSGYLLLTNKGQEATEAME